MNRRGFLGALLAAPVAAAAAVVAAKQSNLSVAEYKWTSFHDGFALCESELEKAWKACQGGDAPDMILCSEDFYRTYTGFMTEAKTRETKTQILRRLARNGSPATQRFAYARLRQLRSV